MNFFKNLDPSVTSAILIGSTIGAATTIGLTVFVPWYRELLVWSWTNPWLWLLGGLGGGLAILLDRD